VTARPKCTRNVWGGRAELPPPGSRNTLILLEGVELLRKQRDGATGERCEHFSENDLARRGVSIPDFPRNARKSAPGAIAIEIELALGGPTPAIHRRQLGCLPSACGITLAAVTFRTQWTKFPRFVNPRGRATGLKESRIAISKKYSMSQELRRRVEAFISTHEMFAFGESVIVGCSGGADSTCLLHVLAVGLRALGLRCTAVYIDHGLREGTEPERELVKRNAKAVGADFLWRRVDVKEHVRRYGGSTQGAARELRYAALSEVAREANATKIAVGHTMSDQAETVLLQLLRGAGTTGISGIAPVRGEVVRPLLDVRREETVRYCQELGLETVEDPSNESVVYLRNRVRLELLPELRTYNSAIDQHLANLAEIFRADDEFIQAEAVRAAESLARPSDSDAAGLWVDAASLLELPLGLARRVVRVIAAKLGARSLAFAHVERILDAARRTSGSESLDNLPGLYVRREYERVIFISAGASQKAGVFPQSGVAAEQSDGHVTIPIPGSVAVDWAGLTIDSEVVDGAQVRSLAKRNERARGQHCVAIDLDAVQPPFVVRPRRPGDRIAPVGLNGRKKLQDLLIDAKVPRSERGKVAVVEDRLGIVWVVGHALDERVRLREGAKRALRLVARSETADRPAFDARFETDARPASSDRSAPADRHGGEWGDC